MGSSRLEHPTWRLGTQWLGLSPWECRATQTCQACPAEAEELMRGVCPCCDHVGEAIGRLDADARFGQLCTERLCGERHKYRQWVKRA